MKIVWDEPKRLANLDKHGLDFADLTEGFFEDALIVPSRRNRFRGIGLDNRGLSASCLQEWAGKRSASSACVRPASRKGSSMRKSAKSRKPYSRSDLREVSDNPEWTTQDFARAKNFREVLPDLASSIRRRGPNKAPTKTAVSLRLSKEVLEYYKSTGRGWQTRIDDALLASVKKKRSSVER